MQGSIILSWVMYRLYLPELFAQAGLAKSVVGTVLLFEVAIAFVLEPLMGYGSDQLRYWTGTRFPLILGAVLLTAVLFFALPPIAAFGSIAQSALPLAAVIWAMAMAAFRSPVLVMLAQCAIASDLPYAAGVLMAVGALAGRVIPLANDFWLSCGVGVTFAIGSIVLLIAIGVLRQTLPPLAPRATTPPPLKPRHLIVTLLRMVAVAIGVVWSGALFSALIAALYAGVDQTPWLNAHPVQVGIVGAMSCLVAAALGQRFGMRHVVTIAATIAIAAFLGRSVSGTLAIGSLLTLAIVVVQNVINVGVIPLAIEIAPAGFGG
ncbi:MAG: SLC45 family MFS transporter, partial [Coleofasciculaceae cyanobacterium RL_1_1]|nr:SLC45 family MFS transporter [Coleofasciculaceae cyanobacterium RL_1_1]